MLGWVGWLVDILYRYELHLPVFIICMKYVYFLYQTTITEEKVYLIKFILTRDIHKGGAWGWK